MSLLSAISGASSVLQVGGAVASLGGAAKALLKPKNPPPGIEGFLFDIPETETVKLQAQITSHFTEDNFSIQDHIAFEPLTVTLVGVVAELVLTKDALENFIQQALDRLGATGLLGPNFSTSAQQYLSEYSRLKSAATSAAKGFNSLYNALIGTGPFGLGDVRTNQQRAYDVLTQMFSSRALIHCETPWRTFGPRDALDKQNPPMVIESLEFFQDADTKDLSRVTVTLKEFRTISTTAGIGTLQGRAVGQNAAAAEKGKAQGASESVLLKTGQFVGR